MRDWESELVRERESERERKNTQRNGDEETEMHWYHLSLWFDEKTDREEHNLNEKVKREQTEAEHQQWEKKSFEIATDQNHPVSAENKTFQSKTFAYYTPPMDEPLDGTKLKSNALNILAK